MDSGLHGPEGNPAGLGDFPVGHSRDFLQHQRLPLVCGQRPEGGFHFRAPAELLRRFRAAGSLRRVPGRLRHFQEPTPPVRPAERIVSGANRDPAQPRPHRPFAAVAGRPPKGAEISLLGGVFGLRSVSQDSEGHGADPALGTPHQFIEGPNVTLLPKPRQQPALLRVLAAPLISGWMNRRMLLLFGSKTRRTSRFVRVGHEWRAV